MDWKISTIKRQEGKQMNMFEVNFHRHLIAPY